MDFEKEWTAVEMRNRAYFTLVCMIASLKLFFFPDYLDNIEDPRDGAISHHC